MLTACWASRGRHSLGDSANLDSVRDRGVGGSNPLAPTNSLKILRNLQDPVWLVTPASPETLGAEPRGRCLKSVDRRNCFQILRLDRFGVVKSQLRSRNVLPAHYPRRRRRLSSGQDAKLALRVEIFFEIRIGVAKG